MDSKITTLQRHDFPNGFIFGTAASAFQVEGAVYEDGREASIWDTFVVEHDLLGDGRNELEGVDQYRRYKGDVQILKQMGVDSYRFSISWSRVLPTGKKANVNEPGIQYYNNLIEELLANGIEPYATILHFDPPQALEKEYLGFLSPQIVDDFRDFAELCFERFGDRVKHWITINEPWSVSMCGYDVGNFPPGRGGFDAASRRLIVDNFLPSIARRFSSPQTAVQRRALIGDPGTEPYIVAHHQLLAHAAAVDLYRKKYQASQNGTIGITLNAMWCVPFTNSDADKEAAERALDFIFGLYMNPIVNGDYPKTVKDRAGSRLPQFTAEEAASVKGSYDFLGLNYYTANYVADAPGASGGRYSTDSGVLYFTVRDGEPIGEQAGVDWLYVYPEGLKNLLLYIKDKYNDPIIHITENGYADANDESLSLWESLYDYGRVSYYHRHLDAVREAIEGGVKVEAYFTWSMLDNFELDNGYSVRFGVNFVDYRTRTQRVYLREYERYPKLSAGYVRLLLDKRNAAAALPAPVN